MLNKFLLKAKNFFNQPLFHIVWFLPVWFLLGISKLIIRFVPFKLIIFFIGREINASIRPELLSKDQELYLTKIRLLISYVASHTPWDSNCFPQVLVARFFLGFCGIPYVVHFGLMRDLTSSNIVAHVWIMAGSFRVTGKNNGQSFTIVRSFASTQYFNKAL